MICRHSSAPIEPPAPGHQHALAANARAEQLRLRRHRIPPQQIADVDIAQLVDLRLAGDEVGQVGQRLHVHAERLELRQDLAAPPARRPTAWRAGRDRCGAARTSSGRESEP